MRALPPTTTLRQYSATVGLTARARSLARDAALRFLAIPASWVRLGTGVRFPYYHHVFDDEQSGFTRQLRDMKNFGEFVTLDEAADLIDGKVPIDGSYFCLTFDDGLKSCRTNALPILNQLGIPAGFFVVTSLVGRSLDPDDEIARNVFGFKGSRTSLDFMDWDDCRELAQNGMTIGSHTSTHPSLVELTREQALAELSASRREIESRIGTECRHFCAPYGLPDLHYDRKRDPMLAREAGYRTFCTGIRGGNSTDTDPFTIRRDHLLAKAGNYQHRYFLTRG